MDQNQLPKNGKRCWHSESTTLYSRAEARKLKKQSLQTGGGKVSAIQLTFDYIMQCVDVTLWFVLFTFVIGLVTKNISLTFDLRWSTIDNCVWRFTRL